MAIALVGMLSQIERGVSSPSIRSLQKLAEICIRRPVFAVMLVLALVVVGAASFFRLGVVLPDRVMRGAARAATIGAC